MKELLISYGKPNKSATSDSLQMHKRWSSTKVDINAYKAHSGRSASLIKARDIYKAYLKGVVGKVSVLKLFGLEA